MDVTGTLTPGLKAEAAETVTDKNTAAALGSGSLPVYSTPAMIALLEKASLSAVDPLLPPGWSTVGTELTVRHIAATPLGMEVSARAELLSIDGRALLFRVEACDQAGTIAEGTHRRFIVENERFLAKTEAKRN